MYMKTKNRANSVSKIIPAIMTFLLYCSGVSFGGTIAKTNIPFKGTASGGTLIIGYGSRSAHFISINTVAGESAEVVVARLAKAIADSNRIFDYRNARWEVNREALAARMALGSILQIKGGPYFLAGTETGLGIPKPPLFLSCSYDKQSDEFNVKWTNPPEEYGEYDAIKISWSYYKIRPPGKHDSIDINWPYASAGKGGSDVLYSTMLPTSYTIKKPADVSDLDMDVRLEVFRHGTPVDVLIANDKPLLNNATPSNIAHIHVTGNGYCQEEANGIPFIAGVAPNWAAWSAAEKLDTAAFEQGEKYDASLLVYNPAWWLLTKPFYQVIKAPPQGVVHGVYRKFLGLTPGHTYRVTACLNTLGMESVTGDWSFSLCAEHNGLSGAGLTVEQLAGLTALPSGNSGLEAGRIAYYRQGVTTKGKFGLVFSGDDFTDGTKTAHITLPPGVDTITVWTRFKSTDKNGKVGFSGVKLEDISANPDLKSTGQVLLEEHQGEDKIIKKIEQVSR